ncbi:MAG: hypothetical protein WD844_01660 [Thermoleophilaceae bacterium]
MRRRPVLRAAGLAAALAVALAAAAPAGAAPPLLPFPSDEHTVADPSTDTGRRVSFSLLDMPRNVIGKPIDPSEYNRADGFSPGQMIVAKVPGLDTPAAFAATDPVPLTDLARSLDPGAPIVVIDADSGERHPIWAELDRSEDLEGNPPSAADTALLIRPAVNWEEGHRYIVALRDLRDAGGNTIEARPPFRAWRDNPAPNAGGRRGHMEDLFGTLGEAGIERESLYLAWDFTVASERSLTERMLHIRDDAFAQLGDTDLADMQVDGASPAFTVDSVENFSPAQDARIARRVTGTVSVPCYLAAGVACISGTRFIIGPDNLPLRIVPGSHEANFICNVPRAAAGTPARPSLYGHGLFGSADGVNGGSKTALAAEHNFMMCATDWIGMSSEDIPNAVTLLVDLSLFPSLVDRVQQGMLNFLFLGRAMIHPQGFSSHPAFRMDGESVIDTSRLYYDGGSQGGIIGGALTAVAPDFDRATLGVPGMNYSTLLRRSVDFDIYAQVMYRTYPDVLERSLILSMIQMLWDRGEANGYAQHMTDDPLPRTPPHEVLLNIAWGDHQVTNWSALVEARTIGASVRAPELDPGRDPAVDAFSGIPEIGAFPFAGSALTVWDVGPLRTEGGEEKGTTPPPVDNVPNRAGVDPHGPDSSETVAGRELISEFLRPGGVVIDPCGPFPCYLDGWTGP